ncbi:hypothetical protein BB561_002257 [Smittium simulii]|uniref:Peptidase S1 domain-containing protein n=1 Tax=Smittium simulii TaxID=133385 RepID=A0A2T9YR59_9FUNG|nr:hypothetical protein BB561_002257 [Smittium simulii]
MFISIAQILFLGSALGVTLSPDMKNKQTNTALTSGKVTGMYANPSQYKFMAQIFYLPNVNSNESFLACNGVLVSNNYILTTGGCLSDGGDDLKKENLRVIVGKVNLGESSGPQERYSVSEILYYEGVKTPNADVALLKLANSIPAAAATPVKLLNCPIQQGQDVILSGFGALDSSMNEPSRKLVHTNVDLARTANCAIYGRNWRHNDGTQICTESLTGNDSCQGDTGAPLLVYKSGELIVAGLVSYGINSNPKNKDLCGINGLTFYSNLNYFMGWIKRVVGEKTLKFGC